MGFNPIPKEDIKVVKATLPTFSTKLEKRFLVSKDGKEISFPEFDDVREPTPEEKVQYKIIADLIKLLRNYTGAGIMDCKKALYECNFTFFDAIEYLKRNTKAKTI